MFGNRGIYYQGWSAVTKHRTPWRTTGDVGIAFDDDVWELYDGSSDWTQANDLSKQHPDKLHELQRLFVIEATRYNVLPLDDRSFERVLPEISGKPSLIGNMQLLLPGMGGLTEQHVVNWRNRSWSLTALVEIPDGGAEGVLLNLGGSIGGWALYLKNGKPTFCYNLFGIDRTHIRGSKAVPAGEHQVRVEFAYDGGGLGKGGTVTLYTDGKAVGSGRVEHTEGIGFGYEYTDVGRDDLSPVTDDYPERDNAFTGTIHWLELEGGEDSHDHLRPYPAESPALLLSPPNGRESCRDGQRHRSPRARVSLPRLRVTLPVTALVDTATLRGMHAGAVRLSCNRQGETA